MNKTMATATEETKKMVILNLTAEEASALIAVLSFVGGNPKTTRRKETDSIYYALHNIGYIETFGDTGVEGKIHFTK